MRIFVPLPLSLHKSFSQYAAGLDGICGLNRSHMAAKITSSHVPSAGRQWLFREVATTLAARLLDPTNKSPDGGSETWQSSLPGVGAPSSEDLQEYRYTGRSALRWLQRRKWKKKHKKRQIFFFFCSRLPTQMWRICSSLPARPPSALAGRQEHGDGGMAPLVWQITLEHSGGRRWRC